MGVALDRGFVCVLRGFWRICHGASCYAAGIYILLLASIEGRDIGCNAQPAFFPPQRIWRAVEVVFLER